MSLQIENCFWPCWSVLLWLNRLAHSIGNTLTFWLYNPCSPPSQNQPTTWWYKSCVPFMLPATSVPPFTLQQGTFLARALPTAIHPSYVSVSRSINAPLERMGASLSRHDCPCESLTSATYIYICPLATSLPTKHGSLSSGVWIGTWCERTYWCSP